MHPDHESILAKLDFAVVACEAMNFEAGARPCPFPSTGKLWMAHTQGGCGTETPLCESHRLIVMGLWAMSIFAQPNFCQQCGQPLSRDIEDCLRWTPYE